ncbi:hypothetical protein GQ600_9911 [Phytophthora cactorum]|nr:hypothetical protein GQ600_9911 [Phytophthora cactorum]
MRNKHHELVDWLRTHVSGTLRSECAQHVIKHAAAFGNLERAKRDDLDQVFRSPTVITLNDCNAPHFKPKKRSESACRFFSFRYFNTFR